jgi:hypothetical protein
VRPFTGIPVQPPQETRMHTSATVRLSAALASIAVTFAILEGVVCIAHQAPAADPLQVAAAASMRSAK